MAIPMKIPLSNMREIPIPRLVDVLSPPWDGEEIRALFVEYGHCVECDECVFSGFNTHGSDNQCWDTFTDKLYEHIKKGVAFLT